MINVSQAYREAVRENREFCIADEVTFPDGSELTFSADDLMAYSINEATSESGKFQIGAAVIKEYSATLDNSEGKFDRYQFEGTDIQAKIGLKLADGSWEYLDKGTYRIVQAKQVDLTINIKAYDNMLYFDRPYSESSLAYPASVNQVIQDASTVCQVAYDASSIVNGSLIIPERPKDDAITFRDVISYCAQLMGRYAKINHLDALEFFWYPSMDTGIIDAGVAKNQAYPSTDDIIDGGSFSSMPEDIISAGDFSDTLAYHHFYDLKSKSINTDDIIITGIQVAVYKEKDQVVQYGSEGYVIAIEDNPLIQNSDLAQTVAQTAGAGIAGMSFRPLSVTAQSDPCIEAGDAAIISEDWKKPAVPTVITNTTFSFGGGQKIDCTAETPTEKTYTRYSAKTRIIAESKQDTEEQMNAYDLAVKQMNQLAANTFGFFSTTVPQPDGSVIAYRHDKKNLSDSKIVYKSGLDGFWVTRNYTGNDNTTVWENGFDSSGNAVMNILSVIGINFSWAHGGTLTLGGGGNGNGRLVILNGSGAQIGYIDNTGVHFNQGSFAGSLSAATGTFSGNLSAAGGTFSGNLQAAGGTFKGDLSAARGTFSGNLQAAGGTFKGALQAGTVTGSTIGGSTFNGGVVNSYADVASQTLGITLENGAIKLFYPINSTKTQVGLIGPSRMNYNGEYYPGLQIKGDGEIWFLTDYGNLAYFLYDQVVILEGLTVHGTKNRLVETENYGKRLLYCYETATPYFGDIGTGKINEEGECCVSIDGIFSETVEDGAEYVVFLQAEGKGEIWVESKDLDFFIVKGTPGMKFAWEIKAIQRQFSQYRLEDAEFKNSLLIEPETDLEQIFQQDLDQYDMETEGLFA